MSFPFLNTFKRGFAPVVLLVLLTSLHAAPALAYVGPGAGLTAIGTMIAVLAVIILAVVGFIWFPLKRLLSKKDDTSDQQKPQ